MSNMFTNGAIFSMFKRIETDTPFAVDPLQKWSVGVNVETGRSANSN